MKCARHLLPVYSWHYGPSTRLIGKFAFMTDRAGQRRELRCENHAAGHSVDVGHGAGSACPLGLLCVSQYSKLEPALLILTTSTLGMVVAYTQTPSLVGLSCLVPSCPRVSSTARCALSEMQ